jgi:hypothetical protein
MLTFQDVTTRGNYYPDRNMATSTVSIRSKHDKDVLIKYPESAPISPRHEYDEARP